jgi:hypothetical protein
MLFWKLFFSSLSIIVVANVVGQIIMMSAGWRQERKRSIRARNQGER